MKGRDTSFGQMEDKYHEWECIQSNGQPDKHKLAHTGYL